MSLLDTPTPIHSHFVWGLAPNHATMDIELSSAPTLDQAFSDEAQKYINDEFEQLNLQLQAELNPSHFVTATARNNYHKNRYSNILAVETTRVKLLAYRDLFLDSDYINANYIDGEIPDSKRTYIACQAPLPSTLSHFWLMLWENESPVIVMLTRLFERDRTKASAYWPENEGEKKDFGPFTVSFIKFKTIRPHLEQRVFEVVHHGQARQIVQLHYTEWPDFGTPESTQTIRELLGLMDVYRLKGKLSGLSGPAVVHCSAGVGRAGTFIAIHICLEKIKYFNSLDIVDIPRTVGNLRKSRTGMVQTLEQYRFIYEVIQDARDDFRERAKRVFVSPGRSDLDANLQRAYSKRSKNLNGDWTSLRSRCAANYTFAPSMVSPPLPCDQHHVEFGHQESLTSTEKKRRLSFSHS